MLTDEKEGKILVVCMKEMKKGSFKLLFRLPVRYPYVS